MKLYDLLHLLPLAVTFSSQIPWLSSCHITFYLLGSLKWWVDWSVSKCVKDCPESATDAECGGLKNFWDSSYASSAACCSARFAWMDPDDCVV